MNKDIVIIGAGVSGLNAAISASKNSSSVLLIEKEDEVGGKIRHSYFDQPLPSSEITAREFIEKHKKLIEGGTIELWLNTKVEGISKESESFSIDCVNRNGFINVRSKSVILSTGAIEKNPYQLSIFGNTPKGVYTSDEAIYSMNVENRKIGESCVVVGTSDRSTYVIEELLKKGTKVEKVVDIHPEIQSRAKFCQTRLIDNGIEVKRQYVVRRMNGKGKIESVDIVKVDNHLNDVIGSERRIPCDTLILSSGRIPDTSLIVPLGLKVNQRTKGISIDQSGMSEINGLFASGEVVNPFDTISHISLSSRNVGEEAAKYRKSERQRIKISFDHTISFTNPSLIDIKGNLGDLVIEFKPKKTMKNVTIKAYLDDREIYRKRYILLRQSEMDSIELNLKGKLRSTDSILRLQIE